jgi:MFS superfamily sulfate permease-like transporter
VYRFGASLYYANAHRFAEELRELESSAPTPLRWICLAAPAIGDVDYSAADTLREIHAELAARQVRLVLAEVVDAVRRELDGYGLTEVFGADAIFNTLDQAVASFTARTSTGTSATTTR